VQPELVPSSGSYNEMVGHALAAARRRGLAKEGERVVVTAGVPFDQPGSTNLMKVEVV
jgi:pyruvate kinase